MNVLGLHDVYFSGEMLLRFSLFILLGTGVLVLLWLNGTGMGPKV